MKLERLNNMDMPAIDCPWCGQWTRLEIINSHYQCPSCKNPVADCCDGETASVYGDVPYVANVDWDSLASKSNG